MSQAQLPPTSDNPQRNKVDFTIGEVRGTIENTYSKGYQRGYTLGWKSWQNAFSVVLGYPLIIYGHPNSGKSQIAFEIMIQLSELYGAKHAVASPETGNPSEVFEELIEMVAQKDLTNDNNNQMSVKERQKAEVFIEEHFVAIDVEESMDKNMDFRAFYDKIEEVERERGIKFWCSLVDTFDELNVDWGGQSRDLALQKELFFLRKKAKLQGMCHIVVAHMSTTEQRSKTVNKERLFYWPAPEPQRIIHGAEWYRRCFTMLGVWRPPTFLRGKDGQNYEDNSCVVLFGKRKPKKVFARGDGTKSLELNWDSKRHRYYTMPDKYTKEFSNETVFEPHGAEDLGDIEDY